MTTLTVGLLPTGKLGLISSRESDESLVTRQEAEEFLASVSPKKEPLPSEDPVDDDPDDLVIGLFIFRFLVTLAPGEECEGNVLILVSLSVCLSRWVTQKLLVLFS